ncbi:hypothetical protein FBULB1_10022, partial [Fusarium bulbicola]
VLRPLISFLQDISNRRGEPIYDQIKRISSHQSPNESSRLQRGPTDKHDEHISRNTRDSDGAGASERTRSDEDGEASQDQRCLTTRETSSLTEVPSSKDAVDKTKKKHKKKKPEKFEVNPEYLKSLVEWIDSPESFFNQNIEVTIGHRIGRFLIDIERSIDLNSIKWRYIVRQIYLSRESWERYETEAFNLLFWVKEGEFYEFLCTKFGIGCLFCDVAKAAEARTMSLPTEGKPSNRKLDEHIATLRNRNIEAVSEQYKLAATKIATYMRDKQIMAGLLKPSKRVADELSDTPGTPLKKVCQRTSPDQPLRWIIQDSAGSSHLRQSTHSTTRYDLTYGTGQESAGTGTETVADDDSSGGRIDGPEPPNAALGLPNDQLSIPSPHSTSHNLLQKFPENNAMLLSPKTTAATMSTTSTPSPAPNTDVETQPRRENSLSDRLQTDIQRPDAVSGALSLGSSSSLGDGSPLSGHTTSSHTDISSASASTPDKFNAIPSQRQSSHEQPQNSQLHVDDLHTSQQSTIIGHMGMGETVAGVSAPASEYLESRQNINKEGTGQKSSPLVAQDERGDQKPGSPHSENQNQGWGIMAGAEHAGIPVTGPQADNKRTYNLLNESQAPRSATYSPQSAYSPGWATNNEAMLDAGQFLRQSPAERTMVDEISSYGFGCASTNSTASLPGQQVAIRGLQEHTSWSATGFPSPSLVEPGQGGTSSDIGDAYDQQPGSTPDTRFTPTSLTPSQFQPPSSQPASGPRVDTSNLLSHGTVTASVLASSPTALPCDVSLSQFPNDHLNSLSSQPPVTTVMGLQDEPRGTDTSQDLRYDIDGYGAGQEDLLGGDFGNLIFIFGDEPTNSRF